MNAKNKKNRSCWNRFMHILKYLRNTGNSFRSTIIVSIISMCIIFSSCMAPGARPGKVPGGRPGEKYTLELKSKVGREIKYQLNIEGNGKFLFQNRDPKKSKSHPEHFKQRTIITLKASGDESIDVDWQLLNQDPITDKRSLEPISFLKVDKNANIIMDDAYNFSRIFDILFSIPFEPVPMKKTWRKDFNDPRGEGGFVSSEIVGIEERDGYRCLKIQSKFEITKKSGTDSFRIEGKGISYFVPEEGFFLEGERSYLMQVKYQDPGSKEKVDLKLGGNLSITMLKEWKEIP